MFNLITTFIGAAAIVAMLFAYSVAGASPTPTVMPAYEPPVRSLHEMMTTTPAVPEILCGSTKVTPVFGADGSLTFEQKKVGSPTPLC